MLDASGLCGTFVGARHAVPLLALKKDGWKLDAKEDAGRGLSPR